MGTFILARRLILNSIKVPVFFILSLSQPILYLVFFGQLFSRVTPLSAQGAHSYVEFLAPGMAILAAMFGSIYSGVGTLGDVERGMFDRIITSPVSRTSIALSYVVATCALVILQATIILATAWIMGARAPGGIPGVVGVILVASLCGIAFGSVSNALAFVTGQADAIMPILNFLTLPMMFLSTTMISTGLMPPWIKVAALFNPLSWAVTMARASYTNTWNGQATVSACLLLAFCLVAVTLMHLSFRRLLRRR